MQSAHAGRSSDIRPRLVKYPNTSDTCSDWYVIYCKEQQAQADVNQILIQYAPKTNR